MENYTHMHDILTEFININSIDNELNIPDYILADYLIDCLDAIKRSTQTRDEFLNIKPNPPPGRKKK